MGLPVGIRLEPMHKKDTAFLLIRRWRASVRIQLHLLFRVIGVRHQNLNWVVDREGVLFVFNDSRIRASRHVGLNEFVLFLVREQRQIFWVRVIISHIL